MEPRQDWPALESTSFALNQGRLAVAGRQKIQLFDFASMQELLSFCPEHMVKSYALRFVGKQLAVVTDYGCVSLYKTG